MRKEIPNQLNRIGRNNHNDNFIELYDGLEKFGKSLNSTLLSLNKTNMELLEKFKIGDNLFDKKGSLVPNTIVSSTGDIYKEHDRNISTAYRIKVKPNTKYYATGIFWFLEFNYKDDIVQSGEVAYQSEYVTTSNAESILISIKTTALDAFMLKESLIPISRVDYKPYEVTLIDTSLDEVVEARKSVDLYSLMGVDLFTNTHDSLYARILQIQSLIGDDAFYGMRTSAMTPGLNLINRHTIILNMVIQSNGKLTYSEDRSSTMPIPVVPGSPYIINGLSKYTTFDEHFNPIRNGEIGFNSRFISGDSERFIILSPRTDSLPRIMFFLGSDQIDTDKDYKPYGGNISDIEAELIFIEAMNKKAKDLGMDRTNYTNSSGLSAGGEGQVSTAMDTMTMLKHALRYKDLISIWGDPKHTIQVTGPNSRSLNITSTVINSILEVDGYKILGGKSGTILNPNEYHLITIVSSGDDIYATVVFAASSSNDRFHATKQLLDFAAKGVPLYKADFKALDGIIVRLKNNQNLYNASDHDSLKEYSDRLNYRPASTIKVMTAMVMLDVVHDLDESFEVRRSDIVGGSGPTMRENDIITYRDALYLLMLPSSNNTAKAIARVVGRKIAESKNKM